MTWNPWTLRERCKRLETELQTANDAFAFVKALEDDYKKGYDRLASDVHKLEAKLTEEKRGNAYLVEACNHLQQQMIEKIHADEPWFSVQSPPNKMDLDQTIRDVVRRGIDATATPVSGWNFPAALETNIAYEISQWLQTHLAVAGKGGDSTHRHSPE